MREQVTGVEQDSRFDRRMSELLEHATCVFYDKGYEGASMRDLSRASGMSLAGLYHYVDSKEKLLYLIQRHTFETIVERLRSRLTNISDPVERVNTFIHNHLEYFVANMKAMKVLSHEDDVLTGKYGEEVQAIKREYYRICVALVDDARAAKGVESQTAIGAWGAPVNDERRATRDSSRTAVLALFGMMNWLYTWYNPRVDGDAAELSARMSSIFLHGILGAERPRRSARNPKS